MVEDKSFFRKALDAMIEARSREAARQVDRYSRIYGCDFGAIQERLAELRTLGAERLRSAD